MQDEFYVKTPEGIFGPVTFAKLVELIRTRRFTLQDVVRRGKQGEWKTAESIMRSLKKVYPELTTSGLETASPKATHPSVSQQVIHNKVHQTAKRTTKPHSHSFRYKLWDTFDFIVDVVRSKLLWIGIAIAIWLGANWTIGNYLANPYRAELEVFQTYQQIWGELKSLREQKADEKQWIAFEQKNSSKLKQIVEKLDRSATPSNQIQMQLLWAGRDSLTPMLTDARSTETASEGILQNQMREIERLLRQAGVEIRNN